MNALLIVLVVIVSTASAQRGHYAGIRPIGYPELAERFRTEEASSTTVPTVANVANRVGDDTPAVTTTTVRLPWDARGDQRLVDRISKWPVDKQPYWYLNWRLIEEQRAQRATPAPAPAPATRVQNQN